MRPPPLRDWSDAWVGRPASSLAAMALALAAVGLLALGIDFLPLQLVLGVLLVFVLPGLVVVNALFAQRLTGGPERAVLILAVSLACTLAGGLLLNLLVTGLHPLAWAGLSAGVTLVFGTLHLLRPRAAAGPPGRRPEHGPGRQGLLQIAAAVVVAVGAVWVAHLGARQAAAPFTQLWLLPETASAETGAPEAVFQLGFRNMEAEPVSYALRVIAGDQVLAEWSALHLAPGQVWAARLSAAPGQLSEHALEAQLYRDGELYRWVNWQPDP